MLPQILPFQVKYLWVLVNINSTLSTTWLTLLCYIPSKFLAPQTGHSITGIIWANKMQQNYTESLHYYNFMYAASKFN